MTIGTEYAHDWFSLPPRFRTKAQLAIAIDAAIEHALSLQNDCLIPTQDKFYPKGKNRPSESWQDDPDTDEI